MSAVSLRFDLGMTFTLLAFSVVNLLTAFSSQAQEARKLDLRFHHGQYSIEENFTRAGIYINAECNLPILTYADGTVVKVVREIADEDFKHVGFAVVIEHRDGRDGKPVYLAYFGLIRPPLVEEGRVLKGEVIGFTGDVASVKYNATGPNDRCGFHFEIRHFEGIRGLYYDGWGDIVGKGNWSSNPRFLAMWSDPEDWFKKTSPDEVWSEDDSAPIRSESLTDLMNDEAPRLAEIEAALAEAASKAGKTDTAASEPLGPPLTAAEVESLRRQVKACWNLGSGSEAARRITVVVGFQMEPTGKPKLNSIRLISASDGTDSAKGSAFEAARRAIIRCSRGGFDLPSEKYESWRYIEITFNSLIDIPAVETPAAKSVGDPSLTRNRVEFPNPEGKPLLSVILIDAGTEGLDNDILLTFTFPVTFALDPGRPGATADSKRLSRGGFEILALAPGDETASAAANPADVASALSKAFAAIPEAVGMIDRLGAGFQTEPDRVRDMIEALGSTGHGLITYDSDPDGTVTVARHGGVASGVIYRVLDHEREPGLVIRRYLDRAAKEARENGHAIVIGHTYPETVTALLSWALSSTSAGVALAPVSASLLGIDIDPAHRPEPLKVCTIKARKGANVIEIPIPCQED